MIPRIIDASASPDRRGVADRPPPSPGGAGGGGDAAGPGVAARMVVRGPCPGGGGGGVDDGYDGGGGGGGVLPRRDGSQFRAPVIRDHTRDAEALSGRDAVPCRSDTSHRRRR